MGTSKLSKKPDEMLGGYLRWASIPSRGSSNTPSRFVLRKRGISSGSYTSQAHDLTFFYTMPHENIPNNNNNIIVLGSMSVCYVLKVPLSTLSVENNNKLLEQPVKMHGGEEGRGRVLSMMD